MEIRTVIIPILKQICSLAFAETINIPICLKQNLHCTCTKVSLATDRFEVANQVMPRQGPAYFHVSLF